MASSAASVSAPRSWRRRRGPPGSSPATSSIPSHGAPPMRGGPPPARSSRTRQRLRITVAAHLPAHVLGRCARAAAETAGRPRRNRGGEGVEPGYFSSEVGAYTDGHGPGGGKMAIEARYPGSAPGRRRGDHAAWRDSRCPVDMKASASRPVPARSPARIVRQSNHGRTGCSRRLRIAPRLACPERSTFVCSPGRAKEFVKSLASAADPMSSTCSGAFRRSRKSVSKCNKSRRADPRHPGSITRVDRPWGIRLRTSRDLAHHALQRVGSIAGRYRSGSRASRADVLVGAVHRLDQDRPRDGAAAGAACLGAAACFVRHHDRS